MHITSIAIILLMSVGPTMKLRDIVCASYADKSPRSQQFRSALTDTQTDNFSIINGPTGGCDERRMNFLPGPKLPLIPDISGSSNAVNLARDDYKVPDVFKNVTGIFGQVQTLVMSLIDWLRNSSDFKDKFTETENRMQSLKTDDGYTLAFKKDASDHVTNYAVSTTYAPGKRHCAFSELKIERPTTNPDDIVLKLHKKYTSPGKSTNTSHICFHNPVTNPHLELYYRTGDNEETATIPGNGTPILKAA